MLRAKNLHNTSDIAVTEPNGLRPTVPFDPRYLCEREEDGQYNDLSKPTMGNASFNPNDAIDSSDYTLSNPGARFGRNIPLSEVDPTRDGDILDPSPRLVSNRLLGRPKKSDGTDDFTPATILNLLAAAWIQFQTHDWFNHGTPRPIDDDPFDVPIAARRFMARRQDAGAPHASRSDPQDKRRRRADNLSPTPRRTGGTVRKSTATVPRPGANYRSGKDGKLKIDPKTKLIPLDPTGVEVTGLTVELVAGLKPAAQPIHARTQRHLRPPFGGISGVARRPGRRTPRFSASRASSTTP